jgi:RNA polymerase sigma factor (sigma-70 family)
LNQVLAAKQSSPSQRAVRREQAMLLAEALGKLPEDYREVIVLRHLEGLSFPDVALRMERTLASVKNLWTRAWRCCAAPLEKSHESSRSPPTRSRFLQRRA